MIPKNIKAADWKLQQIAESHNALNNSYFKTEEYKKYECFFKLKEALQWIGFKELNIADIGCGTGWHAIYLKKEGFIPPFKYTGFDLSPNMCNIASKNFPEAKFNVLDICKNFIIPSYDIVMESAVLELVHNWKDALINMLKSSKFWFIFHRIFIKDGRTVAEQVETYNKIPDIRFHIGMDDFKEILSKENFEIVRSDLWRADMGTYVCRRIK